MYSIVEITDSPEDGIFVTKELSGYRDIPEEEIEFVVNLLRLEDRKVMAVRDVPMEDPFDETPAPRRKLRGAITLLVIATASSVGWWYYTTQYIPA